MVDFSPLWKTLDKKGLSQYYLLKNGIDHRTMDKLRHNGNITVKTVEKLCRILDCTIDEIFTFVKDPLSD